MVTPRMIPHKAVVIHRTIVAYIAVYSGSPVDFQCTIISGWYHLALNHLTHITRQMFHLTHARYNQQKYRKLVGVKTMSLFGYEVQFLLSGVMPVFQNLKYNLPGTEKID